jgi:hypothetical protein
LRKECRDAVGATYLASWLISLPEAFSINETLELHYD